MFRARSKLFPSLFAAAAASVAAPAFGQSDDSDMLAPLVPPAPPQSDDDLLAPLVPDDSDMLAPLVPEKPRKPRKPGKTTHVDEIEIAKPENGWVLVTRKRIDPCGDFEISWGGRKTCHQTVREYHELVPAGAPPSEEEDAGEELASNDSAGGPLGGSPPSSAPSKTPDGLGGSGGAGGAGAGAGSGGGGGAKGPAGSAKGPTAPGNASSQPGASGSRPGTAAPVRPGRDGFARLREFSARLDRVAVEAKGAVSVTLTLRNDSRVTKLLANGDWTVSIADADGLAVSTRAIWMPGSGPTRPFTLMPNVAPGSTQQLRFVLEPEAVRSNLVSLSVQQNGALPATFDLPGDPALRSPALPAPDISTAAFVPLKNVEVRLDKASPVPGGKFELFFTARNRSAALQYLGGSNLVFGGRSATGQAIVSRRETFSIRGPRATPTGMAPIQPGATARLRVLFDAPTLKAPFTVTDGTLTATLLLPPAEEPDW